MTRELNHCDLFMNEQNGRCSGSAVYIHLSCRIHELQEDIIKVRLELESAEESIEHLKSQVGMTVSGWLFFLM